VKTPRILGTTICETTGARAELSTHLCSVHKTRDCLVDSSVLVYMLLAMLEDQERELVAVRGVATRVEVLADSVEVQT
jgi:hypothetical protein